jgi:hypothetical protein
MSGKVPITQFGLAPRTLDGACGVSRPPWRKGASLPHDLSPSIRTGRRPRTSTAAIVRSTLTTGPTICRGCRTDRAARILVVSCGPGYLVSLLKRDGLHATWWALIPTRARSSTQGAGRFAVRSGRGFPIPRGAPVGAVRRDHPRAGAEPPDHRGDDRLSETVRGALRPGGRVIVYAMNGANPLVGSENIAHNIDHFLQRDRAQPAADSQACGLRRRQGFRAQAVRILEESGSTMWGLP